MLPAFSTTGIGSLPHLNLEAALQLSLMTDIPFLAQLPRASPRELMVPAALDGLPGLVVGDGGHCRVEVAAWRAGRDDLAARLLRGAGFEPSPEASRCFQPFLAALAGRAWAKVQLAGPLTVCRAAQVVDPELAQQIAALLLAKALALVRAVQRVGVQPLIFLDEPWVSGVCVEPLRPMLARLRREGAMVGVHCCGEADFRALISLPLDVLSFDADRCLEAVLAAGPPPSLVLSFGVAATSKLTLPSWPRALLTPSCGLAFSTEAEALEQLSALSRKRAQAQIEASP